jgi:hypothetical protein
MTTVAGVEVSDEGCTAAKAGPANAAAATPMPLISSSPLADNLARFIVASLEDRSARQLSTPA